MLDALSTSAFWIALAQIIWVNILLSGDNAVVIALAARNLRPRQQKNAVWLGSLAAIVLRVVLTLFAVQLLQYPYLKLVGAVLLLWIGVQLLVPEGDEEDAVKSADNMLGAIKTILVADLVMSLDNVIAVAAAAEAGPASSKLALLIIGLGLSIPLIIFGSTVLLRIMERFPIIITLGAALLGFVAGEMAFTDPAIHNWSEAQGHTTGYLIAAVGAVLVVIVGKWLARRQEASQGPA